jgi:hypothetical protein
MTCDFFFRLSRYVKNGLTFPYRDRKLRYVKPNSGHIFLYFCSCAFVVTSVLIGFIAARMRTNVIKQIKCHITNSDPKADVIHLVFNHYFGELF